MPFVPHKDTQSRYGLPNEVLFCERCTISNQRPRITFTEDGICSACIFAEKKKNTDWDLRENKLVELLEKHRSRDGGFDVVVPCSGGKDGSFVAHQLKERYGMNVLAVTWAPILATEIGKKNLEAFVNSGFNHILGRPNPEILRRLVADSFVEVGDPFQPFIYGQTNFPVSIAKKFSVSLIMYGENGEVEYGGDSSGAESPIKKAGNAERHYFSGKPLQDWVEMGYREADLALFQPPRDSLGIEQHFFGYYKKWDPQENFYYASENLGFEANPERSEGTYSKYASLDDKFDGFHYYLGYLKFGLGRATSDSAHEIRDGKINRSEGVALVEKYDGEFPAKHFNEFLEFTNMSEEEFWQHANSWRSPHIWKKTETGEWRLKTRVN